MHCRCEINIDGWTIVCIVSKFKQPLFGEFSIRYIQPRFFGDLAIHHLGFTKHNCWELWNEISHGKLNLS